MEHFEKSRAALILHIKKKLNSSFLPLPETLFSVSQF